MGLFRLAFQVGGGGEQSVQQRDELLPRRGWEIVASGIHSTSLDAVASELEPREFKISLLG
jgi:hypothetical protein